MKKNLLILFLLFISGNTIAQRYAKPLDSIHDAKIIAESNQKAFISYKKGDYLSAYKYFLIYKYSHLDLLNSSKNLKQRDAINQFIDKCQAKILSGNISKDYEYVIVSGAVK